MQTSTIVILACLIAVVAAAQYEHFPAVDAVQEAVHDTPVHDRSPRTKRGLLLLKKKLLLGVLGLKAVKVGAVGVAGALALKSKSAHGHVKHGHVSHGSHHPTSQIKIQSLDHQSHHHFEPAHSHVEVHDWSG